MAADLKKNQPVGMVDCNFLNNSWSAGGNCGAAPDSTGAASVDFCSSCGWEILHAVKSKAEDNWIYASDPLLTIT